MALEAQENHAVVPLSFSLMKFFVEPTCESISSTADAKFDILSRLHYSELLHKKIYQNPHILLLPPEIRMKQKLYSRVHRTGSVMVRGVWRECPP